MQIYKRKIRVVIGQEDAEALAIEDLFIKIDIKKFISGKPNEGSVSIYNLLETNENRIKEKGVRIRTFAGYGDDLSLLYDGDIRRVSRDPADLNRVTTIFIGGNVARLSNAIFNKSYSGQVSVKQIVEDAIPSFGLESLNLEQIPDSSLFDYSFTGKTSVLLDEILTPVGVQWFEDDNFIKFSAKKNALESVVLLNKNTGLIGSPTITDKGIKFRSTLNGKILMNNRVRIESEMITGVFKVTELSHAGDNRDGKFETFGVGVELEQ